MTKYNRIRPVCLSQMYKLKKKDTRTWDLLNEGNYSVSKSDTPFTAIGPDYVIEQENHALKVLRSIKGISNLHQALDEYFLTAAGLGNMIKDFCETFEINDNKNTKSDDHYQLAGSKNIGIVDNGEKLSAIFNTYNVNFNYTDSLVYNIP